MLKNSSTLAVSVPINVSIKLGFVSVNDLRETYFVDSLENELCYDYNCELCSFSNLSVTSPTSQLILQPFRRFTYITARSPTLLLLHLRHNSFSTLISLVLRDKFFT